jgi:hypothetical protein
VGVNIKKGGSDPELKPPSEYPPWVAELATPQETIFDLRKQLASKGQENLEIMEVRALDLAFHTQTSAHVPCIRALGLVYHSLLKCQVCKSLTAKGCSYFWMTLAIASHRLNA